MIREDSRLGFWIVSTIKTISSKSQIGTHLTVAASRAISFISLRDMGVLPKGSFRMAELEWVKTEANPLEGMAETEESSRRMVLERSIIVAILLISISMSMLSRWN